jgi:hypothetical protein
LIHDIESNTQADFVVFKYAIGGTTMAQWLPEYVDNGGVVHTNASALYTDLLAALAPVLAVHGGEVRGIFWMQGESDAIDANYASFGAAHGDNLRRLISRFRTDVAAATTPFVLGRIYDFDARANGAVSTQGQFDAVRTAQVTVATTTTNTYWVDTDAFILNDVWHFNAVSQLSFGRCLASALLGRTNRTCAVDTNLLVSPTIIFSLHPDGPAGATFATDETVYARAVNAGADANDITACLETIGDATTSCVNPANWTVSAPWTYDAAARVWRNTISAGTRPVGIYRGWWMRKATGYRSSATAMSFVTP